MIYRRGFVVYLAVFVSAIMSLLTIGALDVSRLALDLSRSSALETTAFQSADGGLERAMARLSKSFSSFEFSYLSSLEGFRQVLVNVKAYPSDEGFEITSHARVFDGKKLSASKKLMRKKVLPMPGRAGIGIFSEIP